MNQRKTRRISTECNRPFREYQHGRTMLFYSGGCRFCRWTARRLHDMDPDLAICPFREPEAEPYMGDVPLERRIKHWWVITKDGQRFEGNRGGGVALLSEMHGTKWLGRSLKRLKLGWVVDRLDDLVNRSRPILSGWITDGPAPKRHV